MNSHKIAFVLRVAVLAFLLLVSTVSAQDLPPRPTHVLVISLDGTRPDALLLVDAPNIQALAASGAAAWEARTVLPAVTLPAHTSMLTGLTVEQHGVNHNSTLADCTAIEAPTFLTLAEEAGYRTALVTGKQKFCIYQQTETLDYTFAREGDRSVADRVIELLDEGFAVFFVHFPNPDYFGHKDGWMSETYLNELSNTDYEVGRILSKLEDLGLTEETLVILTADHGGHEKGHGADIPEDRLIPWLIAGPGVEPGTVLSGEVSVIDTVPTILWALGLPQPDDLAGRAVTEAFGFPVNPAVEEATE